MLLENPALIVFYQKARAQPGPLCDQLIAIERKYQAKLARAFPKLTKSQVLAVHGLFHGMISAPFMTEEALKECYSIVFAWIADR